MHVQPSSFSQPCINPPTPRQAQAPPVPLPLTTLLSSIINITSKILNPSVHQNQLDRSKYPIPTHVYSPKRMKSRDGKYGITP